MNQLSGISKGESNLALGMSTAAFTVCFAVWTIFSIIGVQIKEVLGLNKTQFGLLIGTPILTGSCPSNWSVVESPPISKR